MTPEVAKEKGANKGEWSEIYTFFKLLVDRSMSSGDGDGRLFSVLKLIRDEKEEKKRVRKIYDLTGEPETTTVFDESGATLAVIKIDGLRNGVKRIFKAIQEGKGSSFFVPEAREFMNLLQCSSIKASSADKSDIRIVMQDRFMPGDKESGFSIKSAYHSPPTLLNASKKNTSLVYKIVRNKSIPAPIVNLKDRVRDHVSAVYVAGGKLEFVDFEGKVFRENLELVDEGIPKILAALLALYHQGKPSKISKLVTLLPEYLDQQKSHRSEEYYKHKVKQLLEAIALGMTPGKPWDGKLQATGGYIVVKDDGELACYHLYDREKFLEYLYDNTKIDSPDMKRHDYGTPEQKEDGEYIKLNVQIRFI